MFGYRSGTAGASPFPNLSVFDVEFDDDVYLIPKESALLMESGELEPLPPVVPSPEESDVDSPPDASGGPTVSVAEQLSWRGSVPAAKWMKFYTSVLAKFATSGDLDLEVTFRTRPDGGLGSSRVEETKAALRELGLSDDMDLT